MTVSIVLTCFEMFLPFLSVQLGLASLLLTIVIVIHEMKMLLLQMMMVMDAALHLYLLFSNLISRKDKDLLLLLPTLHTHLLHLFAAIPNLKK